MGFINKNEAYCIEYYKTQSERYYLRIQKNSIITRTAIVFMKNPSTTCNNLSDNNTIISSCNDKKIAILIEQRVEFIEN